MAKLIVAGANLGVIGQGLEIPWKYPADLKWFKKQTMDGLLIVGRKTWESLPPKLPGRKIIVVSSNPNLECDWPVAKSVMDAIYIADTSFPLKQVWIAGGGQIYAEALRLNLVSYIYYSEIPEDHPIDSETIRLPDDMFEGFELETTFENEEDPRILHKIYRCLTSPQ